MPIVPIICVVVLLVGVVAIVMSRESWQWQNITLASLLLVFGLLFFFLAAKNLKIQESWRKEIAAYEKAVADVEELNEEKREGEYDAADGKWITPSFDELKRRVQTAMQGRGRVWHQAQCTAVAPETGALVATVQPPVPQGAVLFIFDGQPATNGGLFLGEFEVTKVDGQQVELSPVLPLRQSEIQLLGQRRNRPLVLYEIMPTDSHDLFAEFEPAQRMALFPNTVPSEVKQAYAKDGNAPAENETDTDRIWRRVKALRSFEVTFGAGDKAETQSVSEGTVLILDPKSAEERIAAGDVAPVEGNDKVYRRELRDYARLHRDLNLRIDSMLRSIADLNGKLAVVQEAQKKVDADLAYRTKEIELLTSDLARFEAERERMKSHVAALETSLGTVRAHLREKYEQNIKLEEELVRLTYEAANRARNPVALGQ